MINVVYDACVLFSASLRDLLLNIAAVGLVHPYWSDRIHEEWMRSLIRKRPHLLWERLERTRQEMNAEFPHSLVTGFEEMIPTLQLPDINDRHVLALAIYKEAKYIVTFNLDDFPKTALQPYEIEALSPDEFVQRLIKNHQSRVLQAVKKHRLSLTRSPKTVDEYLSTLEKQEIPKIVAFLRNHESEI